MPQEDVVPPRTFALPIASAQVPAPVSVNELQPIMRAMPLLFVYSLLSSVAVIVSQFVPSDDLLRYIKDEDAWVLIAETLYSSICFALSFDTAESL